MSAAHPTGPAVVAVGGGHGLAVTLRACRPWAGRLTAVVSVADDGGSSGRIRAHTGLPAVGDIRRCLSALAAPEAAVLARAMERRFRDGELAGHAAGNLLLAALVAETGDLAAATRELARPLGLDDGCAVLPAATGPVHLVATLVDGREVRGQVAVEAAGGIDRVRLDPAAVAPAAAVEAVAAADMVVLGPGSLFGSVLAAAVVPDLRDAIAAAAGRRVFVANLRARPPETAGYDVAAHLAALDRHGVAVDAVVCHPGALALGQVAGVEVVTAEVAGPNGLVHDPAKLGPVLRALALGGAPAQSSGQGCQG